ncbi:Gfo/Idh/MocA family oxidoreductase [uncultured Aeromicrobium sp.]|uniref:Gfo/Idh/MocA family oxidoreductase n=1 Tax=uncultured Aeromicrobium sp. TaxID=337820 RepID=UPI0025CFE1F5|nr:Gfo/Idh/MocA family oxidoreductase [uncultured Aeromicrobium sp.]
MKIGLIGAGRIGVMHARHLVGLPRVDELVVFDERSQSTDALAAEWPNARAASSLDELLDAVDGAVIAASTGAHPELVRAALAADVPTLCEKPIAADIGTMQRLVDDIEAASAPVVVGFQRRFDPAIRRLKSLIDDGALGTVLVVRATGCDATPPDPAYIATSGGIFRDMLIHDHRVEILGTGDSVAVGLHDPEHTPLAHVSAKGRTVAPDPFPGFPERFRDAYLAEMTTFTDIIAGEADNPSPARDSLVSLRLAEACEESRRAGGRPIQVTAPVAP